MAHPANPFFLDGDQDTPTRVSCTPPEYPFAKNGDIVTKSYEATYVVNIGRFSPTARGTVDPENAGHYLLQETKPEIFQGKSATFRRLYSTVPTEQTVVSSTMITKPSLSGDFPQAVGGYRVFQPDPTLEKYDVYAKQTVTSDTGVAGFYPSGGSYTLGLAGDVTSGIAYNANNSTVDSDLDGLTSVTNRGGVTVTGSYNSPAGFTVTFATHATGSVNTGSLTGYTDSTTSSSVTPTNSGYTQNVTISRTNGTISSPSASLSNVSLTVAAGSITVDPVGLGTQNRLLHCHIGSSSGAFNGGTYTITIFGQTTAGIAYNASFAAVQSALNALSNVMLRGGVTVTANVFFPGEASPNASGTHIRFDFRFPDGVFTGGTFTVTLFGQTTAGIAYNAAPATIEAAIDALSEVVERGGCTVSGAGLSGDAKTISFGVAFANPLIDVDPASLTPVGSSIIATITDGGIGRVQTLVFAAASSVRDLFVAGHGMTEDDDLYIKADGVYYAGVPFTLPDANTIRIEVAASAPYASATSITEAGKRTKEGYEPGPKSWRCKRITSFYLPGVTPGIADSDDIPIPVYQGDSATLLQAIFSGDGTINVQVGDLEQWRESPILSLTRTTINVASL